MDWDKEKTLYFIEKYREEPVLWNLQHPEHYNKLTKEDAWDRLATLLGSDSETCKKKMTSLLASLRREKLKIKHTIGRGKEKVYKTTWFAYKPMMFLLDRNTPCATTDTLREGASEQSVTDCPPAKTRGIESPPPTKRKKTVVLNPNPEDTRASTPNILKNNTEQTQSTSHKLDECEAFGVFLANKLRSYSKTTKTHVQYYISKILFSADRGEYDCDNYSYNSTRPTISRASSMPQQNPKVPASHTSDQNDCRSPVGFDAENSRESVGLCSPKVKLEES